MNQISMPATADSAASHKIKHLMHPEEFSCDSIQVSEFEFSTDTSKRHHIESPKDGLVFIFNLKSDIQCSSTSRNVQINLGSFQSIMISEHQNIHLIYPAKADYHFCILTVTHLADLGNFKANFLHANFDSKSSDECWYTGIPNIKLSNFIFDLMNLKHSTANNQHLIMGYANIIIGSKLAEFQQYTDESLQQVDLKSDEIDRIHECIQFVRENFAQQIDIDLLCLKTALSPQKLQKGFRELYGSTVNSFIKDFRLEKAEELMRTTEMNVSEVVYSIGLTSRSYFSKIFREKYALSPNDYLKKFKFQNA
ncbi:helix-turn-helix transcriptional regulator [Gelidibacter salicanalis]|uniref:Helix-turn-helix transcriptional regulator n=1 Tax=Gelidibacter salicanalis TaxID=291193 RepID=A0A5C7AQK8_9FLAO|nr:AraC family transcriptional regulator [Gelidibacter salicanalis]TXE10908.1 helix-turn-helix transcriptional regulator [Gelidibacter salicanalis]